MRLPRAPGAVWMHITLGAFLGVAVLHPVTMAIYWFEFHPAVDGSSSLGGFILRRMGAAFTPSMLPMTTAFIVLGAAIGVATWTYSRALRRRERALAGLRSQMGRDTEALIAAGENEQVEFKETARWDTRRGSPDRAIEDAVLRTIAGFMNHRGGNLLIGVADDGDARGLSRDYHTLQRKDADGFTAFIVGMVRTFLGGDFCSLVHVLFHNVGGHEICRVVVEPAHRPAYVNRNRAAHYFLRTGNGTRELDVQEAVEHIAQRWPHRR